MAILEEGFHLPDYYKGRDTTSVFINIHGKLIDFSNFRLEQVYGEHHYFEFRIPFNVMQKEFFGDPSKQIDLIGESILIELNGGKRSSGPLYKDPYTFKGIVTGIGISGKNGTSGYYLIKGASMSIRLDQGKRSDVYAYKNLFQIFALLNYSSHLADRLKLVNNPTFEGRIDFLMQYDESDWEFIQRICYQYNINLFYYKNMLVIGEHPSMDVIALSYDRDILDIDFEATAIPNLFTEFVINDNGEQLAAEAKDRIKNVGAYEEQVHSKQEIFPINSKERSPYVFSDVNTDIISLREIVSNKQSQKAGNSVKVKGIANTHLPIVGRTITISLPKGFLSTGLGKFIVTKSVHILGDNGRYENHFEAVSASVKTVPVAKRPIPVASAIEAEVLNTKDPLGMGRVGVFFPFNAYNHEIWMRVLTPDAGVTTAGSKNRGLVFIPEKGSKVMVNFERNNPAFPYVAGALFNASTGQGGGIDNAVKSITTRSGIELVLNDTQGSASLKTPSGETVELTGRGDILIHAPKSIKFHATDIEFHVQKDLTLNVGRSMLSNVGQYIKTKTQQLKQLVFESTYLQSGSFFMKGAGDIKLEANKISTSGIEEVRIHSDQNIALNAKGDTDIKSDGAHNFVNLAEDYQTTQEEIDAEVIVNFLPRDTWKGEFGFDWMRIGRGMEMGMTATDYDQNYKNILGHHENNNYNQRFIADENDVRYDKLKREYGPRIMTHKLDEEGKPKEYYVPILRLYRHPEDLSTYHSGVELLLQIEVMEEPDELYLEYNSKHFQVRNASLEPIETPMPISPTAAYIPTTDSLAAPIKPVRVPARDLGTPKGSVATNEVSAEEVPTNELETASVIERFILSRGRREVSSEVSPHVKEIILVCTSTFSTEQEIRAIAVNINPENNTRTESLAGVMRVKPNSKLHRKINKLVFINVIKNDIRGRSTKGYDQTKLEKEFFHLRKILRQAYIDPVIEHYSLDIEKFSEAKLEEFNRLFPIAGESISCGNFAEVEGRKAGWISRYLKNEIPEKYRGMDYTRVFYFNFKLNYTTQTGNTRPTNGFSLQNTNEIVMGNTTGQETIAHEALHSLGVEHIFETKYLGNDYPNAKHTFRVNTTKNVMDYVTGIDIHRHFIYDWQAEIANKNATTEPSNYKPMPTPIIEPNDN